MSKLNLLPRQKSIIIAVLWTLAALVLVIVVVKNWLNNSHQEKIDALQRRITIDSTALASYQKDTVRLYQIKINNLNRQLNDGSTLVKEIEFQSVFYSNLHMVDSLYEVFLDANQKYLDARGSRRGSHRNLVRKRNNSERDLRDRIDSLKSFISAPDTILLVPSSWVKSYQNILEQKEELIESSLEAGSFLENPPAYLTDVDCRECAVLCCEPTTTSSSVPTIPNCDTYIKELDDFGTRDEFIREKLDPFARGRVNRGDIQDILKEYWWDNYKDDNWKRKE